MQVGRPCGLVLVRRAIALDIAASRRIASPVAATRYLAGLLGGCMAMSAGREFVVGGLIVTWERFSEGGRSQVFCDDYQGRCGQRHADQKTSRSTQRSAPTVIQPSADKPRADHDGNYGYRSREPCQKVVKSAEGFQRTAPALCTSIGGGGWVCADGPGRWIRRSRVRDIGTSFKGPDYLLRVFVCG